jgi:hypothetical protein
VRDTCRYVGLSCTSGTCTCALEACDIEVVFEPFDSPTLLAVSTGIIAYASALGIVRCTEDACEASARVWVPGKPREMVAAGGWLYWTADDHGADASGGAILRCALGEATCAPQAVAAGEGDVHSLVAADGRLAWVRSDGTVRVCSADACMQTAKTIVAKAEGAVEVGLDRGDVFWRSKAPPCHDAGLCFTESFTFCAVDRCAPRIALSWTDTSMMLTGGVDHWLKADDGIVSSSTWCPSAECAQAFLWGPGSRTGRVVADAHTLYGYDQETSTVFRRRIDLEPSYVMPFASGQGPQAELGLTLAGPWLYWLSDRAILRKLR